jgi:hypothetical protein
MTQPFKQGDIVRHRRTGKVGVVRSTAVFHDCQSHLAVDMRVGLPRWGAPASDWELYDEDALARSIRRFLACIAMAAAMRQAAISLAISMTSAQARVMADWVGKVSPPIDPDWGKK